VPEIAEDGLDRISCDAPLCVDFCATPASDYDPTQWQLQASLITVGAAPGSIIAVVINTHRLTKKLNASGTATCAMSMSFMRWSATTDATAPVQRSSMQLQSSPSRCAAWRPKLGGGDRFRRRFDAFASAPLYESTVKGVFTIAWER
jgi:hypothetical protein